MKTLYFLLTAKSPLIFNESPKTTTQHLALDYIPGSAVLGAVLAKEYGKRKRVDNTIWQIFYNDTVQFRNGYIAQESSECISRCLPNASAWNTNKYDQKAKHKQLFNACQGFPIFTSGSYFQPQPKKGHYFSSDLNEIKVGMTTVVKTAIDRITKTAAESQLYGYSAITEGQKFILPIVINKLNTSDDFVSDIVETVCSITHLGRSRTGEFGEVNISLLEHSADDIPIAESNTNTSVANVNIDVIWCISDLYLPNGLNHQQPFKFCGVDAINEYQINWDKSVIKRNQISLFNRKRGGFDSTLDVIKKGSVIVLKQALPDEVRNNINTTGLGRRRCDGFGEVILNPAWFYSKEVRAEDCQYSSKITLKNEVTQSLLEETDFIKALKARVLTNVAPLVSNAGLVKGIVEFYLSSRRANKVPERESFGPSGTQWHTLSQTCREYAANDQSNTLAEKLFGKEGLISKQTKMKDWQIKNEDDITFSDYLQKLICSNHSKEKSSHQSLALKAELDGLQLAREFKNLARLNLHNTSSLMAASKQTQISKSRREAV